MTVLKRYVLRLFISIKYITANVVDRNNGRIVVTASTVEHSIKDSLECGRSCNAKAAAVVGEVLAMQLRVEGLEQGQGRGIHVDLNKEIEKKGFKNCTKIWTIVNSLRNNGVKLLLDDNDEGTSRSSFVIETFVFLQRKKWIEEHVFRILNLICRKNVNRGGWLI